MTFHELAAKVLSESSIPLTSNEIWKIAEEKGYTILLGSNGKTPWDTLAARLYSIARDSPNSKFKSIGERPKRFYLKDKPISFDIDEYESGIPEEETNLASQISQIDYREKDLHAFLCHFAHYHLKCQTKTINHSTSDKRSYGEWVHPDIVGCVFPIGQWDQEVLELSAAIGDASLKFISFELKKELNLSTLRESFFQTVSNSSWANESYLVASKISTNPDFQSEISRLSTSFGIGIIQLNVEDPNSSFVLFPSKTREQVDWETVNKLTVMNKDFKTFIKRVKIDFKSNEIRSEKYDPILNEDKLLDIIYGDGNRGV